MIYTRENPSPRYKALIEQYQILHSEGEKSLGLAAEKTFAGFSLVPQAERVKALVVATGAQTVLDYGSGKGRQYDQQLIKLNGAGEAETIPDYWDVEEVHCYDPNYEPFSRLPESKFDGVVSTDVLEHCPEDDLPWILNEIFGYAERFVFVNIACYPAKKHLPNGENAHCTIRSASWWNDLLHSVSEKYPTVLWEAWLKSRIETPEGHNWIEQRLSNFAAPSA
jgi:hypothetical protein